MSGSLLFPVYPAVTASVRVPRIQPRQTTGHSVSKADSTETTERT